MERFYTISHKGKKIVVLDYSNTSPEEAIAFFADAHRRIATYPPKSALIFADATQARFNEASVAAIKEFAAKNTPYVKASASIGTPGLQGVIHPAIERTATRNIRVFDNREDALDWLASLE